MGALWIALLAVITYAARFASTWWLVSHEETARFDPHTFGLLGDAVLLSVMALPLAALLWWILRRRGAWRGLFASASSPARTIVSVALLLLLGAPTPNQIWAVILLPPNDAWPAVLSGVSWFAVVALLRAVAVTKPHSRPKSQTLRHARHGGEHSSAFRLPPLPGGSGRLPPPEA